MTIKILKSRLRSLRKIRLALRKDTVERKDINQRIGLVKSELNTLLYPDPDKQKVMDELTKLYKSEDRTSLVDLREYTIEQLKFHLNRMKKSE